MAHLYHIGQNVAAISALEYENDGYNTGVEKLAKEAKYKHLIAISVNMSQMSAARSLKKSGFKEHVTFYSSHGKHETLTFWVKTNKKFKDLSKDNLSYPASNCSTCYKDSGAYTTRFMVAARKDKKNDLPDSFMNVKGTPIYFSVAKTNTVPETKLKFPPIPKAVKGKKTAIPMFPAIY